MATVRIPGALQALTRGRSEVRAPGASAREILAELDKLHPGLAEKLLDERGEVRRYVSVFHDGEDIRYRGGLDAPVGASDELLIVLAIAGG
jgi:molybdopterin synthase sulfur carrier subunit